MKNLPARLSAVASAVQVSTLRRRSQRLLGAPGLLLGPQPLLGAFGIVLPLLKLFTPCVATSLSSGLLSIIIVGSNVIRCDLLISAHPLDF